MAYIVMTYIVMAYMVMACKYMDVSQYHKPYGVGPIEL